MFGFIRYYDRNKTMNKLLEEYRYCSNVESAEGKSLIIEIEDWRTELPLRMNELRYLNRENIGYAILHFPEKGFYLLYDDFKKDTEAMLLPFNEGKITIEANYKKKKQSVSFSIGSEK